MEFVEEHGMHRLGGRKSDFSEFVEKYEMLHWMRPLEQLPVAVSRSVLDHFDFAPRSAAS